jgi:cyclopropane fatty-acyl-phospholipid synthase-like methyltransferase
MEEINNNLLFVIMVNFRPLAYKNLVFNSPLSQERADSLVNACSPASKILDIGCGWAEFLLQMLVKNPKATGIGIDTDVEAIERGKILSQERYISERVNLICDDATKITDEFDLVVCLGARHIWNDIPSALQFLSNRISSGGKLLLGEGIYMNTPSPKIKEVFGELSTANDLQKIISECGFEVLNFENATIEEWDTFESSWRKGLETSQDPELQAFANHRKLEYENGYRGVLGFCYVYASKVSKVD